MHQAVLLDPVLASISDFIEEHDEIVERVRRDLLRGLKNPDTGRPELTATFASSANGCGWLLAAETAASLVVLAMAAYQKELLSQQLLVRGQQVVEASQHKSHFLAAASHDLSQPIHLLGLFVAAAAQPYHVFRRRAACRSHRRRGDRCERDVQRFA
jgi:signal transduction histidine kinase